MDFYFPYGSNMNFEQMKKRCPGSRFRERAKLPGWRYFINGRGYAGVEKVDDSEVQGCIWELKVEDWNALDAYEGVDQGYYHKKTLEVYPDSGSKSKGVLCSIYISNDYGYGVPSIAYQEIVLQGGREVGLAESYLDFLSAWVDGKPKSFMR